MNFLDTGLGIATVFFLVLLALLWFLLPFAIFGTKDLIEEQIKQSKETNALLKQLIEQNKKE